jgi:hypothetical protein
MSQPRTIVELLDKLALLGFYRYDNDVVATSAKDQAIQYGWPFFELTLRGPYQADSEDLTEGDAVRCLQRIQPFLQTQGIVLKKIDQEFDENGYDITVDDLRFNLYREEEVGKHDLWEIVTRRFLRVINTLFESAKSSERAYLLYGGNDAAIVFLTPEMHALLRDAPMISEGDKPIHEDEIGIRGQ